MSWSAGCGKSPYILGTLIHNTEQAVLFQHWHWVHNTCDTAQLPIGTKSCLNITHAHAWNVHVTVQLKYFLFSDV